MLHKLYSFGIRLGDISKSKSILGLVPIFKGLVFVGEGHNRLRSGSLVQMSGSLVQTSGSLVCYLQGLCTKSSFTYLAWRICLGYFVPDLLNPLYSLGLMPQGFPDIRGSVPRVLYGVVRPAEAGQCPHYSGSAELERDGKSAFN